MQNKQIDSPAVEYVMQGNTLHNMDRYEEALVYYAKAEKADPMYKQTYFAQGESLIMLDRFDDAQDAYEKALMIDKKDGEVYFHLGNVAFLRNDEKAGREYYAKAQNNGYDGAQLYLNMGYMLFSDGAYDDAIEQLNKAIARDEFQIEAWMTKAKCFVNQSKNAQAIQTLSSMLELMPEVADGYHLKFVLEMQEQKFKDAEKTINRALHFYPESGDLCYDKLLLLEAQEKTEEALAYIEETFPQTDEPLLLLEKAKLLSTREERLAQADELFDRLIAGEDDQIARDAAYAKGLLKFSYQHYAQSAEAMEASLSRGEHDLQYFTCAIIHAQILEKLERKEDAVVRIQALLSEIRMVCLREKDAAYYLLRSMYHRFVGEMDAALEMVNFLISVNPGLGDAYQLRAQIYEEIHEPEKAQADKDQAARLGGELSRFLSM